MKPTPIVGADTYTGYYVGISANEQRIEVGKSNGSYTQLATAPMALTANTMYRVKVVVLGSSIKIYVTDMATPKITITDASYASGAIGVRTYQANAKFDNISVY